MQHRRIAHAAVGDLDGPYLQCLGIDAQVYLAPLPAVLGAVFLAFAFTFAQELDPGAVHQQVQGRAAAPVRQPHLQRLLATAEGAEVGYPPVHACQAQQALHQPQALAQGQTEQALDAQAKLNRRIAEDGLATAFATGRRVPLHVLVQPDRQRSSRFERGVVRRPVRCLLALLGAPWVHSSA
ncbi:hypothetical protein AVHM3334_06645 [Acidovorax sp. SUPP3334]|nr:hypothetical protein AVHM3334_06645 [Acidovorax sp. SUPP3334]